MLVQKETLNKLKDFGLNTYESRMWVALLSRGVSTAGELSDIANVPRSRSYDVLESLKKKGFVEVKQGKMISYAVIPPKKAIENLKQKTKEEAKERLKGATGAAINELIFLHNRGAGALEQHDLVGMLKGRKNLFNQILTTIRKAKRTLTIVTNGPGLEELWKNLPALKESNANGVKIKICVSKSKESKKILEDFFKYATITETKANIRACIADKKEIVLALCDDKKVSEENDGGIWFTSPKFAETFEKELEKQQ